MEKIPKNSNVNKNGESTISPLNMYIYPDGEGSLSKLPDFILNWIEEHSNGFFSVWSERGVGLYFSKAIKNVLGFEPEDLLGKSFKQVLLQEDIRYLIKEFDRDSKTNQTFHMKLPNIEQNFIWCECKIAKLLEPTTSTVYYVASIRDITEKKETEEMMIRSEKMSIAGQLAAGIAHEIRNPLTSIKGFLQLLQAGVNRKDVYYKIMIDEIEKMETITSEMLFVSKPLTENKQQESLLTMLQDVLELLKPQAKLKNVLLEINGEEQDIFCDKSQMKQVFINIIKNAIEAMEEAGKIVITIREVDNDIFIDISDEGPGIDEAVIHKLGEPFFTTKQQGTGLGLMITKQLLDRHRAKLEILQNEIKGSTFRIIFPKH
ncbi:ATP-binding protein [Ornithinibacillus halotolerans]|uniref:histidine kinase n=1 Tax=Ornithinibacillus halotolerans TaxID=1274357 RepID=A0A916RM17_9BACI|nr:ATP-binding protein [Ornithinibacillus halotolerans]GGA62231.1 hypothetical protein GCM10008025_02730 [Ornithinibacillus halotolerans]